MPDTLDVTVPAEVEGQRLDRVLALYVSAGLRARRRLCDEGLVRVNGRMARPGLRIRTGQQLSIDLGHAALREVAEPESSSCLQPESCGGTKDCPRLVARGATFAALYKPAGLPTLHLAGSRRVALEDWLPHLLGTSEGLFVPCLMNRLDGGTSGLVVAAVAEKGVEQWHTAEKQGTVCKRYLAVAEGRFQPGEQFCCTAALDTAHRRKSRVLAPAASPERWTRITVLATLPDEGMTPCVLAGCQIVRGARHQIRAHLGFLGMPLVGDVLYGARDTLPFRLHHARLSLHDFTAECLPDWLAALPLTARTAAEAWLAASDA